MKRPHISDQQPHNTPTDNIPHGNNDPPASIDHEDSLDIDPVIRACILQLFHDPDETLNVYSEDR